ncbi:MAG: GyrI-like domain-containing protein [Marinilabiliales bacterium]|nr:GyrI-like domain-containing protein [Marinilabiliales bacterium]
MRASRRQPQETLRENDRPQEDPQAVLRGLGGEARVRGRPGHERPHGRRHGRSERAGHFQEAVGALYSVAYTLKFAFKKEKGVDYPVMALEGLWDADDPSVFMKNERDEWKWTILIVLPDAVTQKDVAAAVAAVRKKAKFPRFPEVRFEKFAEGLAAQIMHVGPYAAEAATVERLHRFIEESGIPACAAATTRSIWATRGARRRRSCGRSSATRSRRPDRDQPAFRNSRENQPASSFRETSSKPAAFASSTKWSAPCPSRMPTP